jgi:Mg-chelatase subunit ChlD
MSATFDESKLTAYVLGELSDAERADVERHIASSDQARREVDEIRAIVALLSLGLLQKSEERLTEEQRRAVEAASRTTLVSFQRWRRTLLVSGSLATAASVLLAVFLWNTRATAPAPETAPPTTLVPTAHSTPAVLAKALETERRLNERLASLQKELMREQVEAEYSRLDDKAEQHRERAVSREKMDKLRSLAYVTGSDETDDLASLRAPSATFTTESYDAVKDNPFIAVSQDPLSTFSVDVDTASYANIRRYLRGGRLPPAGAVRIEEMINYFDYGYAPPRDGHPFAILLDSAVCPWAPEHRLVRVALKGRVIDKKQRPATNLVFLVDVSGSMQPANKLPLLQEALRLLVGELDERDRVSLVVYAGASGLVLPPTSAARKSVILAAIDRLSAGGTTHGSEGICLAYETASRGFIKDGANRVILATDGDFNVGITNQSELVRLIEKKAKSGVFLTVLGVGMGNYKDSTLEKLADHGNGHYAYIDTLREARRVLVEQLTGTLVTIAKDVKIQIEFNPLEVASYRLIGYENRVLAHQDFDDRRGARGDGVLRDRSRGEREQRAGVEAAAISAVAAYDAQVGRQGAALRAPAIQAAGRRAERSARTLARQERSIFRESVGGFPFRVFRGRFRHALAPIAARWKRELRKRTTLGRVRRRAGSIRAAARVPGARCAGGSA